MQGTTEKTLRKFDSAPNPKPQQGEGDSLATSDSSHEPHKTETGPDFAAPENPHFSSTFDEFAGIVPRNDSVFLGARGEDYESYKRAYDFGYRMTREHRFSNKDWVDVAPELQHDWEKEGRDWDTVREAIQQGWEAARGLG
jgi:hypothetical protein